ncbi:MAG: hypothetical protein PWP08_853 [Methanofollis sp.]|nr:hypothetical protein [Methanofollis sp.]
MQFHYALVDDLISRDEFERRVQERIEGSGGLLDEDAAALLVVGDCGRQHLRVGDIRPGPSLLSFFGRVLSVGEPTVFTRQGGEEGLRASLLLGDATGRVEVVLWDDSAEATAEIEVNEVLEVIGRLSPRGGPSVSALALRKSRVFIDCPMGTDRRCTDPAGTGDLTVRILAVDEPKGFTRRDGSAGMRVSALIGDATGTARLVCWDPALLDGYSPGETVRIGGARTVTRGRGTEFSLDEKGTVTPAGETVEVPVSTAAGVRAGETVSLCGRIVAAGAPKSFMRRDGGRSWVRNLDFADDSGTVRLVLWGEHALASLAPGDEITVHHARAKNKRSGGIEISVGTESHLVLPRAECEDITFEGTVVLSALGPTIDNGVEAFLLACDLLPGIEVRVEGKRTGTRITPCTVETVEISRAPLERRLDALLLRLSNAEKNL